MRNKYRVQMLGTGIALDFECADYELVGLHADTFWKVTYADGIVQFINCFGLRTATFTPLRLADKT